MMKVTTNIKIAWLILFVLVICPPDSDARTTAGIHYIQVVTDLADVEGFDTPSLGVLVAISFGSPAINFEFDLDILPNYGFSSLMIQPAFYLLTGSSLYGGVGIGIGLGSNVATGAGVSHVQDSPFIGFKAGVKITHFDFFASYRLQDYNSGVGYTVENDNLDSVTVGALYRF